jgi:hypothetical protein
VNQKIHDCFIVYDTGVQLQRYYVHSGSENKSGKQHVKCDTRLGSKAPYKVTVLVNTCHCLV